MEETKLDKIIGKFFSVFEKFEKRFGEFVTWIIFQFLTYLYFVGLFISSIWHFVTDNNPKLTLSSPSFRNLMLYGIAFIGYTYVFYSQIKRITDIDLKILKFSQKYYSEETAKLCFEPLIADWKTEYSSAVSQNLNWKSRWISIRYAYAFISAIIMQSKIGRFIQIIFKS